jgi:type II secretory pathway component PulC
MKNVRSFAVLFVLSLSGYCFADEAPAGCVPYFKDGAPAGWTCSNENDLPNPKVEALGLKNGDVIKSVDGQTVNSPENAFQLIKKPSAKLEVQRDDDNQETSTDSQ